MTKRPAWYGGNKIPDSYLKRFSTGPAKDDDLPHDLRLFLSGMDREHTRRSA